MLSIHNLSVSVGEKKILNNLSFSFKAGKTYAILGPNGSGKSTLAGAVMGHPDFSLSHKSRLLLQENSPSKKKRNIKHLSPDKRAALGMFLSFQTPLALPGVTVFELLRLALEGRMDPVLLHKTVKTYAQELGIKEELLRRSLNDGFSGGERKKFEVLQAAILQPRFALFDEIDTGVDVDALKTIARFTNKRLPKSTTRVFITHSAKLLTYMKPDAVLVIKDGRLVKTGSHALAQHISKKGFENITA